MFLWQSSLCSKALRRPSNNYLEQGAYTPIFCDFRQDSHSFPYKETLGLITHPGFGKKQRSDVLAVRYMMCHLTIATISFELALHLLQLLLKFCIISVKFNSKC